MQMSPPNQAMGYTDWVREAWNGKFRSKWRISPSMAGAVAIRRISEVPVSLGFCLILGLASPCRSMAADHEALKADAEEFFRGPVTPFVTTCPTRAGVNFSPALKDPGHAAFTEQWKKGAARVKAHDMPPKSAPQPNEAAPTQLRTHHSLLFAPCALGRRV